MADPYAAFPFVVEIGGESQAGFTECTLPVLEVEVEEVKEGGFNVGTHLLPGRVKRGSVTLKRGLTKPDDLLKWYSSIAQGTIERRTVSVVFYDNQPGRGARPKEVMRWNLVGAYPHKWTGPALNSASNQVAIETLELSFQSVTVE